MSKDLGASQASVERWLPIPDFEDRYEVSSLGRVRSLFFDPPRIKATYPDKDGYPLLGLWRRPFRRQVNLHRLVAEVFHASKRNALHNEVAHLDGCRTNCHASNLAWVSKVENHSHMRLHGTHLAGAQHGSVKLTRDAVSEIAATPDGAPRAALAAKFGVCRDTISSIRQGRTWKIR